MASLATESFMTFFLATSAAVFGCGVIPAASARNFTVTGFTLPVAMVYSTTPDVRVPGIASSEAVARGFVERLLMQTVFDVLENQARNALLPDAVTSAILSQLTTTITYTPLMCAKIHLGLEDATTMLAPKETERGCIVISSTVTGICTNTDQAQMKTCESRNNLKITAVSGAPLTISGSLSNHKYYHGELVENDVAKCGESSGSNVGIGSVWIALLLSDCHCRWKLKFDSHMLKTDHFRLTDFPCKVTAAIKWRVI